MTPEEIEANKAAVLAFLKKAGIAFDLLEYPPIRTVAEGEAISEKLGTLCCKCLLMKNRKGGLFLFMLPGAKRFKSGAVAKALGTGHLSFADETDLAGALHTFPGAVSPMGLLFDTENRVRFVLDESVLKTASIDCHPCHNGASVKMSVADFTQKFLPAAGHAFDAVPMPEE